MTLVPIRKEDENKNYYKYYLQGIASPSDEQMKMVYQCGHEAGLVRIKDRKRLQDEGMFPEEFGYYPLEEGGLLCAGNIPMPDVTADMLYWWFAWHGLDPFRYAIWDPEDHFDVQIDEAGRQRALDDSVPMNEKTWGATHTVMESIGGPAQKIVIGFMDPEEMGFDKEKIGSDACEFLVSANALLGDMKVPVIMDETLKEVNGIKTFMARFWIGYQFVDGEARCLAPVTKILPEEEWSMIAKGLLAHNIKEFSNLNRILPSVFGEEKDNF